MEKKKAVKKAVKKVEKPVKVSLKDKLTETVNFIEKAVKEERGINLPAKRTTPSSRSTERDA